MKLTQKLPIGLGLACLMFMSSCSKDDIQTPQPENGLEKSEASMRGGMVPIAYVAPTNGVAGKDIYPQNWSRLTYSGSPTLQELPTGTSSLTHLFGNLSAYWIKPLPAIPSVENMSSVLTTSTESNSFETGKRSTVKTKITNLIPNTKYTITYYVCTSIPFVVAGPANVVYAQCTKLSIVHPNAAGSTSDFRGVHAKPNEWVKATVSFTAKSTEAQLEFNAATKLPGQYAYANLYIDKNSIKKN